MAELALSPEEINGNNCNLMLQNHVLTASTYIRRNGKVLAYTPPLRKLASLLCTRGCEWNHKRFTSARWQFRNPKVVVLYFSKGTLVVTGANKHICAIVAMVEVVRAIRETINIDLRIKQDSVLVRNVVFSGKLPNNYEINLQGLLDSKKEVCQYDPDRFPGLALRPPSTHPMTLLVFATGSLIVTGTKSFEAAKHVLGVCLEYIRPMIVPQYTFTQRHKEEEFDTNDEEMYSEDEDTSGI